MAIFTQELVSGTSPPYGGLVYRQISPTETWAAIRAANATDTLLGYIQNIASSTHTVQKYYAIYRAVLCFDLTELGTGFTATAASLHLRSGLHEDLMSGYWSDTNRGAVLVTMDESVKVANVFEQVEYQALYGSFVEISNVLPFSSFAPDGDWNTLTLNSTGIAYLNTVRAKANFPGYVHIGIAFPGDVRNVAPAAVPTGRAQKSVWYGAGTEDPPYFTMTYNSSTLVNIGDSWKSVESMQVNGDNEWFPIDSIQPNIGDDWKDLV
jgi:hypothetical protein